MSINKITIDLYRKMTNFTNTEHQKWSTSYESKLLPKPQRVIQELMHDTAPKKAEDLHEIVEKDYLNEDSWN
jgi:hypothetical protein